MYNSTAYIQTSVNLPAPFSQGQAVSSSNYQRQYQGSQQYAGNVPGYQQKNVVQPGTSQASGYYQQTPNQAFQSKPGVVGSGPIPQSQIPSSQYQQPTPNQGFVAQQNIGPGSGQGQGQGQYSQPPRVMTPQGQSLPSQVQPVGQAPLSYQQALQPVSSQQSANTPVPFSSQYPQQISRCTDCRRTATSTAAAAGSWWTTTSADYWKTSTVSTTGAAAAATADSWTSTSADCRRTPTPAEFRTPTSANCRTPTSSNCRTPTSAERWRTTTTYHATKTIDSRFLSANDST